MFLAVSLLSVALLACGGRSGSFRAKSVHAPDYEQIAAEAVELDPDDVEAVGLAGGERIGQYAVDPDGVNVAREIAEVGGTHFLARGSRTSELGGIVAPGGGAWRKTYRTVVTFDVFRVRVRAWDEMPVTLRPKAK